MTRVIAGCLLVLLAAVSPAAAAEEPAAPQQGSQPEPEVLVPPATRHGGWGGPFVQLSTLRDHAAVFVGGRGGWLIDRRLTIGGGGMGLANAVPAPAAAAPGVELELDMGYGGGWLEYTFSPLRILHVSIGTLIGGGGLSLRFPGGGAYGSGSTSFFVAEPTVMAELNLARAARLDVGLGYRWVVGTDMPGLSDSDVSAFSVLVLVKFGKF